MDAATVRTWTSRTFDVHQTKPSFSQLLPPHELNKLTTRSLISSECLLLRPLANKMADYGGCKENVVLVGLARDTASIRERRQHGSVKLREDLDGAGHCCYRPMLVQSAWPGGTCRSLSHKSERALQSFCSFEPFQIFLHSLQ